MSWKKTLAGVGAAAALLCATVAVAVPALAQDDTTIDPTTPPAESTVEAPSGCEHRVGMRLAPLTDVLGIDAEELRTRLDGGETIADIATGEGIAVDDVVADLVSGVEERLAAAVADGRLTQEEADEKLADATDRFAAAVNGEAPFGGPGLGGRHGFGPRGLVDGDSRPAPNLDGTVDETLDA